MTHCIICGKRLWFENWRSFKKYAWNKNIDTQPWKPKAYLYRVDKDIVLSYYIDNNKSREQTLWYHIKCIKEKGTPAYNPLIDEWKMKEESQ